MYLLLTESYPGLRGAERVIQKKSCMCMYVYVCACLSVCVCMCAFVFECVCMYVCVCAFVIEFVCAKHVTVETREIYECGEWRVSKC